eukprot:gnl/TRDRNA2_/TRDRNA2_42036_c0_seq1.p1 gnl/TRDRNA2_/TRDRNA2_42036_c0~~gnl/TRDRNA2_/TRDRNA2_42036_c0_seq1.p1  ORF type:complete len:488 (-),score=72.00 gnl/TRDRNA2_/TRDRNA2_42036_c0_seq1:95-1558(-)
MASARAFPVIRPPTLAGVIRPKLTQPLPASSGPAPLPREASPTQEGASKARVSRASEVASAVVTVAVAAVSGVLRPAADESPSAAVSSEGQLEAPVPVEDDKVPEVSAEMGISASAVCTTREADVEEVALNRALEALATSLTSLWREFEVQKLVWESPSDRWFLSEATLTARENIRAAVEATLATPERRAAASAEPEMTARALEKILQLDDDAGELFGHASRSALEAAITAARAAAQVGGDTEEANEDGLFSSDGGIARSPLLALGISRAPRRSPVSSPSQEPHGAAKSAKSSKCDKCDGPHATDACPHFKKKREAHKDAWVNYGKKSPVQMGGNGGNFVLRHGRCVRQPGDGNCLFHSLCYGLNGGRSSGSRVEASRLRRELASFVERNPSLEIAGDTLEEWVRWDANSSVGTYARRMAVSGWGGGIEMAACSHLKKVNVHVYENGWLWGYKRISCFDCPDPSKDTPTIHVLYQGGVHYDALVPSF